MTYNLTFADNMTNIVDLITGVNNESGGLFMGLCLLVSFFLFYMWFKREGNQDRALALSSFITMFLGVLFWWLGLIAITWIILPLLLLIGVIIKIFIEG